MLNYNELDKKDLDRLKEIDSNINYLNIIINILEQNYDEFIMNKDFNIKKSANKKINKYLLLPLTIINLIIVGITAITTSKVLLFIILGNIISLMIICKKAIKNIDNVTRENYMSMCDAIYDFIIHNKKEIDKLSKEKEIIINKNNNNSCEIDKIKSNEVDNNIENNYVKTRKLKKKL